jgi:hypothetical protein
VVPLALTVAGNVWLYVWAVVWFSVVIAVGVLFVRWLRR